MKQPDLRTKEGATDFLNYHAPDADAVKCHAAINEGFQSLIKNIWEYLPDGPGKTVAVRSLNRARMDCNSCIANGGQ